MRRFPSVPRRPLAAATALVLATGTALALLPAPAQADSLIGQAQLYAASSAVGACIGTDSDSDTLDIMSSGSQQKSVSAAGTVTDGGDATASKIGKAGGRGKTTSSSGVGVAASGTGVVATWTTPPGARVSGPQPASKTTTNIRRSRVRPIDRITSIGCLGRVHRTESGAL